MDHIRTDLWISERCVLGRLARPVTTVRLIRGVFWVFIGNCVLLSKVVARS